MTFTATIAGRAERKRSGEARRVPLDSLRGLAIVLMVLDHALVALLEPSGAWWAVRLTVTRLALPIFCLVAGHLAAGRPPRPGRLRQVLVAGAAASVVGVPAGIGFPDVLTVFAVALALVAYVPERHRSLLLVVAILQPVTWPLSYWVDHWTGYEPGLVVALILVGSRLPALGEGLACRLPAWLASIGRHPLVWYLGHLVALSGTAVVLSQ